MSALSPYASRKLQDYIFTLAATDDEVWVAICNADYWESEGALNDWNLEPLIGHALPDYLSEESEGMFSVDPDTDPLTVMSDLLAAGLKEDEEFEAFMWSS